MTAAIRNAAPWLGQHSEEIVRSAGYSASDVQALYADGVIYDKYRKQD
jgi:crotonobetainyl-CoA:carnitine CoA-transferase CaiB-like acyl-CoA transferase